MKTWLRNIAAVIVGAVLGSVANMGVISLGGSLVPRPEGADMSSIEGIRNSMHLFEPRHFLFPFLAHAIGAWLGGLLASVIAASHRLVFALVVSGLFLVGGIINALILPAPGWFLALDLLVAYLPMGWLGYLITGRMRRRLPAANTSDLSRRAL